MNIERSTRQMMHYLSGWGHLVFEGSASTGELNYLRALVERSNAKNIGEVGFNAGFSAMAFLGGSVHAEVVSFDLGDHTYVGAAKSFVDHLFPGRHRLILGDSRDTVPAYAADPANARFDLVFVDGGHAEEVVSADLANLRWAASVGAVVVIDDLTPWRPWGLGPSTAWQNAIASGSIGPDELYCDGEAVAVAVEGADRVWAMGRYLR